MITINSEGRYETKLPFKENHELLNDNYELCKKRLLNLHKKLKPGPELMKKYDSVFKEQKDLGIIEVVSESSALGETHYIPHHPVIREDHSTSKSRKNFNASSKTDGPNLNLSLSRATNDAVNLRLRFIDNTFNLRKWRNNE